MSLSKNADAKTKRTETLSAPAIANNSWRFGDLSAAELLPQLQQHLMAQQHSAHWQLVWLNNDEQPMIGLLPRVSWTVCLAAADAQLVGQQAAIYKVIKSTRGTDAGTDNSNKVTVSNISYSDWQKELIDYSQIYESSVSASVPPKPNEPDDSTSYHHGLVGFIGYDIAAYELSPNAGIQQTLQPCAVLGHYDIYLTPSTHLTGKNSHSVGWQLKVQPTHVKTNNESSSALITTLIGYLDLLDDKLSNKNKAPYAQPKNSLAPLTLSARWHKSTYQRAFEQSQDYLGQGDCYQINLTQAWQGRLPSYVNQVYSNQSAPALIEHLPALHHNTQAPFAGYMQTNHADSDNLGHGHPIDFEL